MAFGIVAGATIGLIGTAMASDAQGDATDAAVGMSKDQLAFDKQRYNDWKDIYGPLQEDIGSFYKNLTGQELSGKMIEEIQKSSQEADERITQNLAQRGMGGSGLEADLINKNTYTTEMLKAETRATADELAAEKKMKFLSLGLGQGQGIANSMSANSANAASAILNGGAAQSALIQGATGDLTGLMGYATRTLPGSNTNYNSVAKYSPQDNGVLY